MEKVMCYDNDHGIYFEIEQKTLTLLMQFVTSTYERNGKTIYQGSFINNMFASS